MKVDVSLSFRNDRSNACFRGETAATDATVLLLTRRNGAVKSSRNVIR